MAIDPASFEQGREAGLPSNLPIDGHSFRRVEVLTGTPRRRRWSAAEKMTVVAETLAPGCPTAENQAAEPKRGRGHRGRSAIGRQFVASQMGAAPMGSFFVVVDQSYQQHVDGRAVGGQRQYDCLVGPPPFIEYLIAVPMQQLARGNNGGERLSGAGSLLIEREFIQHLSGQFVAVVSNEIGAM